MARISPERISTSPADPALARTAERLAQLTVGDVLAGRRSSGSASRARPRVTGTTLDILDQPATAILQYLGGTRLPGTPLSQVVVVSSSPS